MFKDDQMSNIKKAAGEWLVLIAVLCCAVGTTVFLMSCPHGIVSKPCSEKQAASPDRQKLPASKQSKHRQQPLERQKTPRPVGVEYQSDNVVPPNSRAALSARPAEGAPPMSPAEAASGKSQLMDDLLDRAEIPSDYGETMTALFRDKTQDDLVRGFAVQHIGLYAQALSRRGAYNPDSPASGALRKTLFDASGETGSGVAAAAFRSLADMTAFDPQVDAERLDYRLVVCAADRSASLASRIMAVQLCGERGLGRIRLALERLLADSTTPHPLRLAAEHSLGELRARRSGR